MVSTQRKCIYAKDISLILGKSYKQSLRILRTVKDAYSKKPHQYVTLEEFAQYTGIDIALIRKSCL